MLCSSFPASSVGLICLGQLVPAEAVYRVIVDHACGLHERIHDGAADELETAALEVFAHGIGLHGNDRHPLVRTPCIAKRLALYESPQVSIKAWEFMPQVLTGLSIDDGRF